MARLGCIVLCALISAVIATFLVIQTSQKRTALSMSTLKVLAGEGHGSGVLIHGRGYIITAAHVVKGLNKVKVVTQSLAVFDADVLWANEAHDVALLEAPGIYGVSVSRLDCDRTSQVGDSIIAIGTPGELKFVSSYGRVSAPVGKYYMWAKAFIADLTIAPGSSGGPVFDPRGRVVGIAVGVSITHLGMFPSPTGFSFIVPSKGAICSLLSRNSE
jgi:S1-C subfamily serine protease